MAEGKNKIIIYKDWIDLFEELTDDEAGKLIKHFFRYVNDKNPTDEDRTTKLSFIPIKATLKRDLKRWEETQNRNRNNGLKGGRPKNKETEEKPKNPVGYSETQPNPKKGDSVSDSVSDSNNTSDSIEKIDWDMFIVVFNKIFGTKAKVINDDTKRKFKARIKSGWTKDEIKNAMLVVQKDKFHIDNNFKYVTLEYFSRDKTLQLYANKNANELPRDMQPRVID